MIDTHRAPVRRLLGRALFTCLAYAPLCAGQQLVVGPGARMVLGNTTLNVGCRDVAVTGIIELGAGAILGARDLSVTGALNGGSGVIELSGNLAAGGNLVPQTGTVRIIDGCGVTESIITGNHQFNRLRVESSTGRALVLPAFGTQTISNALELVGDTTRLLMLSSVSGSVGFLNLQPGGTQLVSRVDAVDVGALNFGQFIAPLPAQDYGSIDRGNTPRFLGDDALAIPALSPFGLLSTIFLFAGFALFSMRTFDKGVC